MAFVEAFVASALGVGLAIWIIKRFLLPRPTDWSAELARLVSPDEVESPEC